MAPEQVMGEGHRIDGRTDIYAMGVILYEMLTGQTPFGSDPSSTLIKQIREDDPQPPRQLSRDLPPVLEAICMKSMAKDFPDRYTTADDLASHLREALRDPDQVLDDKGVPSVGDNDAPPPSPSHSTGSSTIRSERATRRRVTVIQFESDVFESDEIRSTLQLGEQNKVLEDFQDLCRNIAFKHLGRVVQMTDQGVLACFGFPVSVEDATQRAVRAAIELKQEVATFNAKLNRQKGVRISASVVIHTDQAILRNIDIETVSLSGRVRTVVNQLAMIAPTGAIVTTEETHRLVRDYFDFEPPQTHRIKGNEEINLHAVVSERIRGRFDAARMRGKLSRLVGRGYELNRLAESWEHVGNGDGKAILIQGEAGIGKSRLVYELKKHVLLESPDAVVIDWTSDPQRQSTSLHPAITFLDQRLGFSDEILPIKRLSKLVRHLDDLGIEGDQEVALMAALLSIPLAGCYPPLELSPQQKKERTFELVLNWLSRLSRQQPVLFVIEDLHWTDPSSLAIIDRLLSRGLNDQVLVLATFRPEFQSPWQETSRVETIELGRLNQQDVAEMILECSELQTIPADLETLLASRTDGVPLFIEEFASMIQSGKFAINEVPETLQELLLARLDQVESDNEVVQLGAAIGRHFGFDMAVAATGLPESQVQRELDRLLGAGLVYRYGYGRAAKYTFKHALIQDVAYRSMIEKDRCAVHLKIATVSEKQFPDLCRQNPEVLAYHFTQASCWEKSVDYAQQAANNATSRAANQEAKRHLIAALDSLAKLDDSTEHARREVRIRSLLGVHLQSIHGYIAPEVRENYERSLELCDHLNDPLETFPTLYGLLRYFMLQAQLVKANELASQLLAISSQSGLESQQLVAHRAMGCTLLYQGDLLGARKHLEQVQTFKITPGLRAEVAKIDVVDPWVTARSYGSLALWLMGETELALAESDRAIAEGHQLNHPTAYILPAGFSQWIHQFRNDVDRTEQTCDLSDQLGKQYGFPFWNAWTLAIRGWVQDARGDSLAATQTIPEGIRQWRASGSAAGCHYLFALLAQAWINVGDQEQAKMALDQAQDFADETGERFYEAEIARLRGELAMRLENSQDDAAMWFHLAIEIANKQHAKSLERRASESLRRLKRSNEG